jgi:hypothetical protein
METLDIIETTERINKKRRRQIESDDEAETEKDTAEARKLDDEESDEEEGPIPYDEGDDGEVTLTCARCLQVRFDADTKTWKTVAPHFDKEKAMLVIDNWKKGSELWTCNMGRKDKLDYCMFKLCDDERHRVFADPEATDPEAPGAAEDLEKKGSLRWRYCGDGHKTRSNWYRVLTDTNNDEKYHRKQLKMIEAVGKLPIKTYVATSLEQYPKLKEGWTNEWTCSGSVGKNLCGFSNERELRCASETCRQKTRHFGTKDYEVNWALVSARTVRGASCEPTLNSFYRETDGRDAAMNINGTRLALDVVRDNETRFRSTAKWMCGSRVTKEYATDVDSLDYIQRVAQYERPYFYEGARGASDRSFSYCDIVRCAECSQWRLIDEHGWYYMIVKELARQGVLKVSDGSDVDMDLEQKGKLEWKCPYATCKMKNAIDESRDKSYTEIDRPSFGIGDDTTRVEVECPKCKLLRLAPARMLKWCQKNGAAFACCFVHLPCEPALALEGELPGDEEHKTREDGTDAEEELITFNTSNIIPMRRARYKDEFVLFVAEWDRATRRRVRLSARSLQSVSPCSRALLPQDYAPSGSSLRAFQ